MSGGRDSVALLNFLAGAGWRRLIVCHLDHRLRGRDSDADERFVKRLARDLGLRCATRRTDVAALARRTGLSIETAGREARLKFLSAMARRHRCQFIFTAHHADDQAETVLHRLCRGTSLAGAAGMLPASETSAGITLVRPLLDLTRAEIAEYAEARRLAFREDRSNLSRDHTRNRVRHDLLPLMNEVFQRDVAPLLTRFAGLAARDDGALQAIAAAFARRHRIPNADGSLRATPALRRLNPALLSRIVFRWLASESRVPAGSREIDGAMALLRRRGPGKLNLAGGAHLLADAQRLWVEPVQAREQTKARRRSAEPSKRRR